jgi:hypothetical protein
MTKLCGARDPEATDEHVGGDPTECDFLRGHDGPHSWQLERMEAECSLAELERERRQRAARRSRERKAG